MDWMTQIIDDFGRRIGLPGLTLDDKGRLRMALEDGTGIGLLQVTAEDSKEIVVYRSFPFTYVNAQTFRMALRLADFRQPDAWPVQAAINQRELLLAMRIPERAFSSASLEMALSRLAERIQVLKN